MRVELSARGRAALAHVCQHHGMTQVAALSRIIDSFATLPEAIQVDMLRHYPASLRADIGLLIAKHMAGAND